MKARTGLLRNEENKTSKTKQLVCTECIAKWIKVTENTSGDENKIMDNA